MGATGEEWVINTCILFSLTGHQRPYSLREQDSFIVNERSW